GDFRLHLEVELLQALFGRVKTLRNPAFGNREYDEHRQGEANSGNRRDLFGQEVRQRDKEQRQRGNRKTDRILSAANGDIQRRLILLIGSLKEENQDPQRFQEETPNDAERIPLAEQNHITTAPHDCGGLENSDHIDQPIARSVLAM